LFYLCCGSKPPDSHHLPPKVLLLQAVITCTIIFNFLLLARIEYYKVKNNIQGPILASTNKVYLEDLVKVFFTLAVFVFTLFLQNLINNFPTDNYNSFPGSYGEHIYRMYWPNFTTFFVYFTYFKAVPFLNLFK